MNFLSSRPIGIVFTCITFRQNNLFKKTPLQTSFSGNFLALMGSGTVPQRFTLRSALDCFLDFRFTTIRRKAGKLIFHD